MSTTNTNTRKVILMRTYFAYAGMCVFACIILCYLIKIQFIENKKWIAMADSLSTKEFEIDPVRGNIFDINGNLLATSLPIYDVIIDAKAIGFSNEDTFNTYINSLSEKLSDEFKDKTSNEYKKLFTNLRKVGERYYVLKKKITYKQMRKIEKFPIFVKGRYKGGLILEERNRREKPFSQLAERTIGFSQKNVAKVGIEGAYDKYLSGKRGKRVMQRIAGGTWIPINDDEQIAAEHGNDIISTIDINLQDVAENSLMQVLDSNNADWGSVILMEVSTGEIKAIANLCKTAEHKYEERFNYAVGEALEPGSTFKLVSMLAVLEDGKVKSSDLFDTEDGSHTYCGKEVMYESEKHGKGKLNLQQCFELSSNVATSKAVVMAFQNHPEEMSKYYKKLKLDQKIGLQIKGEGLSYIKTPDDKTWSCPSLPWMSIGYEVMVTPLQIVTLYNAVANNGKMVKPFFVKKIMNNGMLLKEYKSETMVEKICSDENLKKLRNMLEGVVLRGTATKLKNINYSVAGKTGTSLVADRKNGYKNKLYRASFCGYFPAENPKYTCYVIVHNPTKGLYYGADIAGPIFKDLADKVYANSVQLHKELKYYHTSINNDLPAIEKINKDDVKIILDKLSISSHLHNDSISEHETDWMNAVKQDNSVALIPVIISKNEMPNLKNMSAKDAILLLENIGVKTKIQGFGKVKSQSIKTGEKIYKGSIVNLQLG